MNTRFPRRPFSAGSPGPEDLRLHAPSESEAEAGELEWVRWLFQSVRAQRTALVFQCPATDRAALLAAWQGFVDQVFLPVLAPALLRSWHSARRGDDAVLLAADRELDARLSRSAAGRSVAAGAILLAQTRGAKYQASLGRFRAGVDEGRSPGHLAVTWAAVAALFQMPPLDLLSEYLREEWSVATQHAPHHEPPQGPLSCPGLAHRALHEAGVLGFGDPAIVPGP